MVGCDFLIFADICGIFCGIAVMENLHTEDRAAEEILIGYFVECQSIKKVGGRRSVEELYQVLFFCFALPA